MEINDLRKLCENKINEAIKTSNIKEINNLKNIHDILENDNCFKILDANIVFNILNDLGFDVNESIKIYSDLLM